MKKVAAIALSIFLLFVQGMPAYADDDAWEPTKMIRTAEELAALSGGGKYALAEDIDLEGFDWKGISGFSGSLNGGSHTIRNLKSDKCGLFRQLGSGARISNIRLENVEIATNTKTLGGIVSYIPSGAEDIIIKNCSVSGILNNIYEKPSRLNFCGAIAGVIASRDCVVDGCSSGAIVEGDYFEGGIVGLNYGKISNSFFTGTLNCSYNNHDYCKKDMVIVDGEELYTLLYYVGGTAGGIASVNFGEISGCAVLFQGFDEHIYFGQISGINIKNKGSIKNCFTPRDYVPSVAEHYAKIANALSRSEYNDI